MSRFLLKDALNQYFQLGCKTHTRRQVLSYGGNDRPRINTYLHEWETRGLVQVVKPLEDADDADVVVKVLDLIDMEKN